MVHEIVDGVFDITLREGKGRRYRCFLFDVDRPTLIDVGHTGYAKALFEGISEVGVSPERLLVTHGDNDHVGCFDAVVERYNLETWVPSSTSLDTPHGITHRVGDREKIGGFEAVRVSGHSEDNTVYINEDLGVAVMGDALMGADLRGLPSGHMILPPEVWSDDLHAAERNLEKLLDFDFEVALVYHGSSITERADEKLERFVNFPQEKVP